MVIVIYTYSESSHSRNIIELEGEKDELMKTVTLYKLAGALVGWQLFDNTTLEEYLKTGCTPAYMYQHMTEYHFEPGCIRTKWATADPKTEHTIVHVTTYKKQVVEIKDDKSKEL